MYGPSSGHPVFIGLGIVLISVALAFGAERCGGYVARHLEMKWK